MSGVKDSKPWSATRHAHRYSSLRDLTVRYEGHSALLATRAPDVSTRGMFINTAETLPEGAVLKVRFRLARSQFEVKARCEVRYCLPGVGVGVEFVEIEPQAVRAIQKELGIRDEGSQPKNGGRRKG